MSPTDAPSEALGAHGQPLAGAGPSDGVAQSNSSNAADGLRSPIQTGSPVLPGVASQLLTVMSPLRTLASGVHVVSVALHPEGLGDVRATMTLNDGSMTLRLVPSTPEAAEAIRIALPELRQGFGADGTTATIVVGDPSGGGMNAGTSGNPATSSDGRFARDDAGPFQSAPSTSTPASSSVAPPSARGSDSNALLDVRV